MSTADHASRWHTPERVLLVRLSAIGDVIFASPLAAAFRRAYPHAHLAWLVEPGCAPLLRHHPDLDAVIEWPGPRLRSLWRERRLPALAAELRALRRDLRARRFDLAVDLQGLLKSALPVWLSGAPQRIGLGSREGGRLLLTRVVPREPPAARGRIGSEYLHLARTLGLPDDSFDMAVHFGSDDAAAADRLLAAAGLSAGYVALCPFTTRPQKHWLAPRWAELAARLRADTGLHSVLLGGPNDAEAGAEIAAESAGSALSLAGRTSLLEAAVVIDRSRAVVAVDTGLGHMGIARKRPTLLLFGSSLPYTDTGRPDARVLYHPRACSPCRRRPTCDGRFDCMRAITVDEVVAALRVLPGVVL
ncbi:glycosyltransferase family 9 protein [Thiohalocapsa sp.]|uniref:glycosyltransferase family 9 protein n=1 Tax=Thiohalocapsa sp. TaxID=2497641 RepID=UPI0025D1BD81|nr:glycosyltransferase family 9 protein [Thiohalocapsa sp.]